MSSLLERMVMRTRAPLPGIEPILQPLYGPPSLSPRPESTSGASEWTFPAPESADRPIAGLSGAPSVLLSPHPDIHISAPAKVTYPADRITPAASVHAGLSVRPENAAPTPSPDSEEGHNIKERRAPATLISILQNAPSATEAADPAATARPSGERAVLQQRPTERPGFKARPDASRPPAGLARSSRPVPGVDSPDANPSPEITISIGHIEVRAAQPVERARRPSFRPRVSLNDFLSQRDGERS